MCFPERRPLHETAHSGRRPASGLFFLLSVKRRAHSRQYFLPHYSLQSDGRLEYTGWGPGFGLPVYSPPIPIPARRAVDPRSLEPDFGCDFPLEPGEPGAGGPVCLYPADLDLSSRLSVSAATGLGPPGQPQRHASLRSLGQRSGLYQRLGHPAAAKRSARPSPGCLAAGSLLGCGGHAAGKLVSAPAPSGSLPVASDPSLPAAV